MVKKLLGLVGHDPVAVGGAVGLQHLVDVVLERQQLLKVNDDLIINLNSSKNGS